MSNNQMVLAPRELLERLDLGKNTAVAMAALPELRELLAKPAEQHQGVPVAVVDEADDGLFVELIYGDNGNPLRRGDKLYTRPAQGEIVGWQFYQQSKWWNGDYRIKDHRKNTEAAGIPTRDVYTHADPAEVERLREENRRLHEAGEFLDGVNQGIEDKLRAQLFERDALLKRQPSFIRALEQFEADDGTFVRLADVLDALSASAEPSAPVEHDDATLIDALRTCEKWFVKHSPTAPLIGGFGDAEHPMLTCIRAALTLKQ